MKVELGEGGLLFHHHGRSPALLHHFELRLLLAHLFLVPQLHLVVALQFLFRVTSLQIELDFNVSDVSLHNLIFLISLSSSRISLHSRNVLPSFLRL